MTDMITAEEAGKLLAEADFDYNQKTNAMIERHAKQIAALHAQLADVKVAQALVVERAAEAAYNWLTTKDPATQEARYQAAIDYFETDIDRPTEQVREVILALADTDGLALVQSLRADIAATHKLLIAEAEASLDLRADRDRLAAANAALEAQVARMVGARPTLNWCRAEGQTIHEMRVNLQSSPFGQALINMGDCALVWANEGDLYQFYAALAEVQADARREGGE